jgi:hypothetical protein
VREHTDEYKLVDFSGLIGDPSNELTDFTGESFYGMYAESVAAWVAAREMATNVAAYAQIPGDSE